MYHITARANHKEKRLGSTVAKVLFLEILTRMRMKHGCLIVDFMVMENHIHLLMEPRYDNTLSDCMKWLLGVYTMAYNRTFKTWGSFWGGRFFSRPIAGLGDLSATIAYIDRNPVRAFLADRPEDWEWGGLYQHRLGSERVLGRPPPWLGLVAPEHTRRGLTPWPRFIVGSDPAVAAGGLTPWPLGCRRPML